MSFEIDGETWEPESTTTHANNIMSKVNSLLQSNNVTDDDGNIIQLTANFANAFYLLALACGSRIADNDTKLSAAINSFNIDLCDTAQVENLLPIAAMTRNTGSYSTIDLKVTASDDGDCTIPAGTKAPFGDYNFIVDAETTISAGNSAIISATCDTIGAIVVLAGEITAFDTSISNLSTVTNPDSAVVGTDAESTAALRQRLIAGDTIKYSLDGCKNALEELTGIAYARVYFNYDITESTTLEGDITLPARHAYIVVHGSSDDLASTYAQYMNSPTINGDDSAGSATTLVLTITASSDGSATIPSGTTCTYDSLTFATSEDVTISAGSSSDITFTCTTNGDNEVPAGSITALDTTITNVESVVQSADATVGEQVTARTQNYVSSSGQIIPIKYDIAKEKTVYVKIVLTEDATSGTQVDNQLKTDLLAASADWEIGESVTSLLTSTPFTNITYTNVAYTLVSEDGETWQNIIEVGCNVIPRVKDSTIEVEQL